MPTMETEADIEPVAAAPVEEQKIDTIKDAIKNVIKKSIAAEGKALFWYHIRTDGYFDDTTLKLRFLLQYFCNFWAKIV